MYNNNNSENCYYMSIPSTIIDRINKMPHELVYYICDFIPMTILLWTNKKLYIKHHKLIQNMINEEQYENYIRDMIRQDNDFVVALLMKENLKQWLFFKRYQYKNVRYANYIAFLKNYCIENDSTNCRNIINDNMNISGLSKNEHKNNIVRNIRWTN